MSWKKKMLILVVCVVAFIAFALALISGIPQFALATAICGRLPVAASSFAAANDFVLPGENFYGPGPFNQYFCTRQQAEKAHFSHSVWTVAGEQEQQALSNTYAEQSVFAPNKISYTAYSPQFVPTGLEKAQMQIPPGPSQIVVQYLMNGKIAVASFRQGYQHQQDTWICAINPCVVMEQDGAGRSIYKYVVARNGAASWAVLLGQTFFEIDSSSRTSLSDMEASQMLGSLTPVK